MTTINNSGLETYMFMLWAYYGFDPARGAIEELIGLWN